MHLLPRDSCLPTTQVTEADLDKNKEAGAVSDIELTAKVRASDISSNFSDPLKRSCLLQLGQFITDLEEPVNVFKLLVNPHSFAQTVENFFFLAFLIKDGMVSLLTVDGEPCVGEFFLDIRILKWFILTNFTTEACEPMTAEDAAAGMAKQQGVWQIDMEMWQVRVFIFLC